MKKLGIIVPYRDREEHLKVFVPYMNEYLKNYTYEILIVEQSPEESFNRAKLCNIGFDIGKKDCDYFVFHDIDLLPLEVDYSYKDSPTHLARRLDYLGYKPCYPTNFGGVTLFDKENFIKINGFSNEYWGWGAEDDDLRMRCVREGIEPKVSQGMFNSLPHPEGTHDTGVGVNSHPNYKNNSDRFWKFAKNASDFYYKEEGLNTLKYTVLETDKSSSFTKVTVSL
jgi:hypothetical protein